MHSHLVLTRLHAPRATKLASGWTLKALSRPSRLFGADALRTGPDGRLYVAQATGSQISALDIATDALEVISPRGSDIVAPSDLAFDSRGNIFVAELLDGRVSMRMPDGRTRIVRDDLPRANALTVHSDRLFVSELRADGRLLELDLNGGAPRILLGNIPMPSAMDVGPDGFLYFPVMGTNEIWRVHPDRPGLHERVAFGLGVPSSVKFDCEGRMVSTQASTGQVLQIDPVNGMHHVLARLSPGIDDLTFVAKRLYVSHISGEISEVLQDGVTRTVLPRGLCGPLDLTWGADGLYIADGLSLYMVDWGELRSIATTFSPNYPGVICGLHAMATDSFIVTTSNGSVARYRPSENVCQTLAQGLDPLCGVVVTSSGVIIVAELGAGRILAVRPSGIDVLASGLDHPMGVAMTADGACLVSESGAGRVVKVRGPRAETLIDGLQEPHGILVHQDALFIVDAGAKKLIEYNLKTQRRQVIAADLPIGSAPGVVRGSPPHSGALRPFAGIAASPTGTLYVSADASGNVLALRREDTN